VGRRTPAAPARGGNRMSNLAWIFVSTLVVNNFTLVMFLGLCSFFGVTAKIETAWRLGLANTFVLLLTAVGAWALNTYVLARTPFLRTIAFIVVVASGVQIVEMAVKKHFPVLFRQLGIYLPLITTNCAILGLALFQTSRHYNLVESLVFAIGAGLGLTLALSLMASIRERIEVADVPVIARRMGLVLVVASCLSMAFMGFAGMGSAP
jgi:electron transport complex protein RnfA